MKPATDQQVTSESRRIKSRFPPQSELDRKMNIIEQRLPGNNGIIENKFPATTQSYEKKNTKKKKVQDKTKNRSTKTYEDKKKDKISTENRTNMSPSTETMMSNSNAVSSSNQTLLTGHLCPRSRDRGTPASNVATSGSSCTGSRGSGNKTLLVNFSNTVTTVVAESPPILSSQQNGLMSTSTSAMSSASHGSSQNKPSATKQLKLAHLREGTSSSSNTMRGLLGRKSSSTANSITNAHTQKQSSTSHRKRGSNPTKDKNHSIHQAETGSTPSASRKRPRSHSSSDPTSEKNIPQNETSFQSPNHDENLQSAVVTSEATTSSRDRAVSRGANESNLSPPAIANTGTLPTSNSKSLSSQKQKKDRDPSSQTKTMFHFFGSPTGKNTVAGPPNSAKTQLFVNAPPSSGTKRKDAMIASNSSSTISNKHLSNSNSSSSRSNINANVQNETSQIDLLKNEIIELRKKCQNQQSEINSIRNNTTIETKFLKSMMQRKEAEIKQIQIDLDTAKKSREKAIHIIEKLILDQNARDSKEKREKLASDGARLGRFVYTRTGLHSVENWEYGHAKKAIEKKKMELKRKQEELELRKKQFDNELKAKQSKMTKDVKDPTSTDFCENKRDNIKSSGITTHQNLKFSSSLELEFAENEESFLLQISELDEQTTALGEEEKALHAERSAHVRELRRIESEDKSRFKHKPKLNNRYILLNLLGKGGFSEVWRAYDLFGLREVAVKIHQLDSRWTESKKENFTKHVSREYEIHRDVRHPRIVSLFDVFEIDNDSFATVLECCKGTDLETLLKEKKILPERKARAILLQILSGMKYLSSPSEDGSRQGIIHYDLKPANILFDELGFAKITDFGLSKIVDATDSADSMELTSQGAGTYWYLPPECFVTHQAIRISNKVDVWSIGVIFYQMLFGRKPFGDGQSQEKVLINHTMLNAKQVKFPSQPKVSKACIDFLECCLMYDQVYRPSISQLCQHHYLTQKSLSSD